MLRSAFFPASGLLMTTVLGLSSCESAARHPAVTIGAVAGTIGFGTCEISVEKVGTCGIIGGTAALALGGITALVTLLANTNAPEEPTGDLDEEGRPRGSTTEEPPGLPAWMMDGGVAPPPPPGVNINIDVDVTVGDAGVPMVDAARSDAM
jgi:hypothetical protein